MYLTAFYLLVLFNVILSIHAFIIPNPLLALPFTRTPNTNFKNTDSAFRKTSSPSPSSLYNDHSFLYLVEIGIGPNQKFTVAIDTGR